MLPIAAFLTGALLSILMPLILLIALVWWYWKFSLRVPENKVRRASGAEPAATQPHPNIPDPLPPEPRA